MPKIVFFGFHNTLTTMNAPQCYYINSMGAPQFNRRPSDESYQKGKNDSLLYTKKAVDEIFKHDANQISAIITRDFDPDYIAGFIAGILKKEITRIGEAEIRADRLTQIAKYQVEGEAFPLLISHYIYGPALHYHEIWGERYDKNFQISKLYQELINQGLVTPMDKIDFYGPVPRHGNTALREFPFINAHLVLPKNRFTTEAFERPTGYLTETQTAATSNEVIDQTEPHTAINRQTAVPLFGSLLTTLGVFAYRGTGVTLVELGVGALAGVILGEAVIAEGECSIS